MLKAILLVISVTLSAHAAPAITSPGQTDKKKQKGGGAQTQPTRESWAWRYGGLRYDAVKSVLRTGDGGFILAGDTRSFRAGKKQDYRRDPFDVWVVKLDSAGGIVWQRTYTGAKSDRCSMIVAAAGGGYMLAGTTESYGAGMSDVWVLRLDDVGNVIWQKTFGGEKSENGAAIAQDSDGSYIVVGDTDSFIPVHENPKWKLPGRESRVLWAFKINGGGDVLWQKTYVSDSDYCHAQAIAPTGEGDFILGSNCQRFVWLLKVSGETGRPSPLESDASLSWSKAYFGRTKPRHLVKDSTSEKQVELADVSKVPFDTTLSTLVATNDGFAMTGEKIGVYSEDGSIIDCLDCAGWTAYWVARLDSKGSVGWARTIAEGVPGYSSAFSVSAPKDGFLVAGDVNSIPQAPMSALPWSTRRSHSAVLRFDAAGEVVWQKEIGGNKDMVKSDGSDPEVFAYEVSPGEHFVARTFHPDKGRKDEEFHLMKLYEDGPRNTCSMGTEKVLSPTVMSLGTMRVIADWSSTKAQTGPSACRVEISTAKPEPTCN